MLEYMKESLVKRYAEIRWQDDFVVGGAGHTRAVSKLPQTRGGRDTAAWYAVGRVLDLFDEAKGEAMLAAIETLQEKDESSRFYGCCRWYAEETFINDSNGAFFVLMSPVALLLTAPQTVPAREREMILRMLRRAGVWFEHETVHGPIHYSNKILADGGMTLAIARLTENDALYAAGVRFFTRFLAYTREEGWGWGENISLGYNAVILTMLRMASRALKEEDAALRDGIEGLIRDQLTMFRFFDGHELTPTIRSYNYRGLDLRPGPVYNLARVPGCGMERVGVGISDASTLCLLFDDDLYRSDDELTPEERAPLPAPRTRITHVFHENEAYSWIGHGGALGTMNNFPAFPDCYQHKTWGLGWQSMPVNAVVYGACTSYLRWVVEASDGVRIHPKHAFLSPALFAENDPYPATRTRCEQRENAALVFRMMEGVDNDAASITDEWYIPALGAASVQIEQVGEWTCAVWPHGAVLLCPLVGGKIGEIRDDDGAIRLAVTRAQSETGHIACRELVSGWAVVFWDGDADGVHAFAESLAVREIFTRSPRFTDRAAIVRGGETLVSREIDIAEPSMK